MLSLTMVLPMSALAQQQSLPIRQFERHPSRIQYLTFSPDGTRLVTSSNQVLRCWYPRDDNPMCEYMHFVLLWNVSSGKMLQELNSYTYIRGLDYFPFSKENLPVFSPDGSKFILGTSLYDTVSGRSLRRIHCCPRPIIFSPNGDYIASPSSDGVSVIDLTTGHERLFVSDSPILSIAFSPDGSYLIAVSADETKRTYDFATGLEVRRNRNPDAVGVMKSSPDGTHLATLVQAKQEIILSDAVSEQEIWRFRLPAEGEYLEDWTFSPSGIHIVMQVRTARTPPFFIIVDVSTGLVVKEFRRNWNTTASCCWHRSWFGFSTGDAYFLETTESSITHPATGRTREHDYVRIRDMASGQIIYHIGAQGPLAVSKDGQFFVLIRVNQEGEPIRLWGSPSLKLQFEERVPDKDFIRGSPIVPFVLPNAIGGIPPVYYTLTPEVPAGLQYDAPTRTILGVPTVVTSGPVEYTYTAASLNGEAASLTFEISVSEPTFTETTSLPEIFKVVGSYPNPFRDATQLAFDLPWPARVRVDVMDVLGRRLLTVPENSLEAGWSQTMKIEGASLPAGIYLYRLIANPPAGIFVHTGRFVKVQ